MHDTPIHPRDLAELEALYDRQVVHRPGVRRWGGRVVKKFGRLDTPAIHLHLTHGMYHDRAAWLQMADSFREDGKDGFADLMALIGNARQLRRSNWDEPPVLHHDPQDEWNQIAEYDGPEWGLTAHGVTVALRKNWRLKISDYHHHGSRTRESPYYTAEVMQHRTNGVPTGGAKTSQLGGVIGSAVIGPEHVARLMDEDEWYQHGMPAQQIPFHPDVEAFRGIGREVQGRIDRAEPTGREPERFGAWRAPTGGMVTRGIYQPGGRFLPAEAGGRAAPQGRARRLLSAWRRRRRMRGPGVVGMGGVYPPASPPVNPGGQT